MEYRTLYLPVGLTYSGKSTMGQILKETYNGQLKILGPEVSKNKLYPKYLLKKIDYNTIDHNKIFINSILDLENTIKDIDVYWDSSSLSRQNRAIISFIVQKTCFVQQQPIKIIAIDLDIPFNIILKRYQQSENNHYSITNIENMFKTKIKEHIDLNLENIDELFIISMKENEELELTKWEVSNQCTLFDQNDTTIADLMKETNKKFKEKEKN